MTERLKNQTLLESAQRIGLTEIDGIPTLSKEADEYLDKNPQVRTRIKNQTFYDRYFHGFGQPVYSGNLRDQLNQLQNYRERQMSNEFQASIEIIRSGGDWLVRDGSGKILLHHYESYTRGQLPREVTEAIEKSLLQPEEQPEYDPD